jgi:hypothetical protein
VPPSAGEKFGVVGIVKELEGQEVVFPRQLQQHMAGFKVDQSHFLVQPAQRATMRVVLCKEMGLMAYTLEASFLGGDCGAFAQLHYSSFDLARMGHDFCLALLPTWVEIQLNERERDKGKNERDKETLGFPVLFCADSRVTLACPNLPLMRPPLTTITPLELLGVTSVSLTSPLFSMEDLRDASLEHCTCQRPSVPIFTGRSEARACPGQTPGSLGSDGSQHVDGDGQKTPLANETFKQTNTHVAHEVEEKHMLAGEANAVRFTPSNGFDNDNGHEAARVPETENKSADITPA